MHSLFEQHVLKRDKSQIARKRRLCFKNIEDFDFRPRPAIISVSDEIFCRQAGKICEKLLQHAFANMNLLFSQITTIERVCL